MAPPHPPTLPSVIPDSTARSHLHGLARGTVLSIHNVRSGPFDDNKGLYNHKPQACWWAHEIFMVSLFCLE